MNWLRTNQRRGNDGGLETPVTSLQNQMNRLFSSFMDDWNAYPGATDVWGPAMDIEETAEEFIVTAELPGVDPDDVQITAVANELTIRGEMKEQEVEGRTRHRRERRSGSFFRMLALPANVNADQVKAQYRNGILTLTLPKREEAKPRNIKIQKTT
jgi:HSP20 family protein